MFKMKSRIIVALMLVFLVVFLFTGCNTTSAETSSGNLVTTSENVIEFPEKPVNLVVWGSPGGGSDIFGRTLARASESILGKPVVVENKPGGGGATAMAFLSSQKADGYTALAVTTNLVLTPLTKGTPNTYKDFDPVIMVGKDATMTIAKVGGEFTSIENVVEIGKQRTLKWGTFGIGTTDHVAAAIFAEMAGIDVDFVPFDGGGEAMAALLGGHIDLLNGNPSEVASQIEAEQLVGIGVYSEEKLSKYDDVPTFKEKGYDILVETWRGIVVPKGTPEEIKNILFVTFEKALEDDLIKKYYEENDIIKEVKNGQEFYKFIELQDEFFKTTLTDMGIL